MSCEICGHTMNAIGLADAFWCPRCGSMKYRKTRAVSVPKIVDRVRELREKVTRDSEHVEPVRNQCGVWVIDDFESLGIDECLGPKEEADDDNRNKTNRSSDRE